MAPGFIEFDSLLKLKRKIQKETKLKSEEEIGLKIFLESFSQLVKNIMLARAETASSSPYILHRTMLLYYDLRGSFRFRLHEPRRGLISQHKRSVLLFKK